MTTTEKPAADNGVNVQALLGARDSARRRPPRSPSSSGARRPSGSRAPSRVGTVETFFGLGEEQEHTAAFTFDADHPLQFASEDNGATPVEYRPRRRSAAASPPASPPSRSCARSSSAR